MLRFQGDLDTHPCPIASSSGGDGSTLRAGQSSRTARPGRGVRLRSPSTRSVLGPSDRTASVGIGSNAARAGEVTARDADDDDLYGVLRGDA
jgi:hypothetical protein